MGTAARLRRRVAGLGPRDVVRVFRMRCAGRLPPTLGPMPRGGRELTRFGCPDGVVGNPWFG